jgi:hypothetical protein
MGSELANHAAMSSKLGRMIIMKGARAGIPFAGYWLNAKKKKRLALKVYRETRPHPSSSIHEFLEQSCQVVIQLGHPHTQ